MCVQPSEEPPNVSNKYTLTLRVSACGTQQILKLIDMYYAKLVMHDLISCGKLGEKGYALTIKGGRRVVAAKDGGRVVIYVDLRRNVLVVSGTVEPREVPASGVIFAVLTQEAAGPTGESVNAQKGISTEMPSRDLRETPVQELC
ncbi:hypothetical protein PC129_g16666 [Phytophthora cactorum]|uniref:Uncharacterized protein n=2 Tax=Phytophthora cactorum TaxID=29920 RepID=A0A329REH3_9STRA|nr:hypothetical protein Pcac1_g9120 [Phytophthora cactorum]KAG2885429.1 hypothetical protein PC114_g19676 [Phytophthora cactorum]KAG2910443.1 hypothetical protein PC117_g19403 [Phytophthora cactorum]KAG2963491.1 hypothetical protein PC118_g20863 [Phytophthora cactorum]KAG2973624.1 hypothetical protein PC119_g22861 [Phytophthora cactorum]